jgi:large subunit ribosomal protein L9
MTKIILNQTVTKLGVAGDIVDVKPGYARNYLLPTNAAILWTKRAGEQVQLRKAAAARRAIANAEAAQDAKAKLEDGVLQVPAKAGANGKLFGSITTSAIADAVKATHNLTVDKRKIHIPTPIKVVGPANATIHLFEDVVAEAKLSVVPTK